MVTVTRAATVVLVALLWVLPSVRAEAQRPPSCRYRETVLATAVVGPLVMQEGVGLGAVKIGSTVGDIEQAWGLPQDCVGGDRGFGFMYHVSDNGGKTGLPILVGFDNGRVETIGIVIVAHMPGPWPPVRTARGVPFPGTVADVYRVYGTPPDQRARCWNYVSEGVLEADHPLAPRLGHQRRTDRGESLHHPACTPPWAIPKPW